MEDAEHVLDGGGATFATFGCLMYSQWTVDGDDVDRSDWREPL